jgi:hypothetical protein
MPQSRLDLDFDGALMVSTSLSNRVRISGKSRSPRSERSVLTYIHNCEFILGYIVLGCMVMKNEMADVLPGKFNTLKLDKLEHASVFNYRYFDMAKCNYCYFQLNILGDCGKCH